MLHNLLFYKEDEHVLVRPVYVNNGIDLDHYLYLDMSETIWEKMFPKEEFFVLKITIENGTIIKNDTDFLKMFRNYKELTKISLYVKTEHCTPVDVSCD